MTLNNANILPVSVIIPTLNCREKISAHLDGCKEWLPYVQEVIVVDSYSSDGTYEILKTFLASYECKFIQTGPGLYKSWNHGVNLVSQKYIYFSTVGETITLDGLSKMVDWSEKHNLDLVISAPDFIFPNSFYGDKKSYYWPIHSIIPSLLEDINLIEPTTLKFLAKAFCPESIIGSSASNLYRATALKKFPFPETCGNQGDVLWGMLFLDQIKVGISKLKFSTFYWDGDRDIDFNNLLSIINAIKEKYLLDAHIIIDNKVFLHQVNRFIQYLEHIIYLEKKIIKNCRTKYLILKLFDNIKNDLFWWKKNWRSRFF